MIVFKEDEETGDLVDSWEISEEDVYWEHHGDCLGPLEQAKQSFETEEDWENEKDDLIVIPKGAITFHTL